MDYELSEEDRRSLESDIEEFVSDERLINFLSTIFKAMGDPTRLKIIFLLSKSPLRVNEISELLNMSQSSISHQLAILRNQELIKVKRIGRYAIYSLDDEHVLRLFNEGYNHAEHKKRNWLIINSWGILKIWGGIYMSKVVVYTSNTCPYCTMAKDYLKEKNIAFEEKNVQTDAQARTELMSKGYTGVPVIVVDNEEIVGFDKAKLDTLLDK